MKKKSARKIILVVACVIIVLCGIVFAQKIAKATENKVDYTEFLAQLDADKIESVSIDTSIGKMTYKMKDDSKSYYTNYPYTEDFREKLLLKGVDIDITEKSWLVTIISTTFPYLIFALLAGILLMSIGVDGDGVDFKSAGDKMTKFSDVAGMDEIKDDLMTIVDMVKNPEYNKAGARIPRGILLQGPPGNGKTLLAKAFAGEAAMNFIAVNACDFGSKFVGVGSTKIKRVFETAKKNAPCVIFIDELDAVGAKRASASDAAGKEMNTILTSLLNQMDGFTSADNVMVLAATNRVDDIDDALLRPGRFDRQFVVDYPDKRTRIELCKLYTKGKEMDEDVDFERLAGRTYGYSCSKIATIVNEALILSVKNKRKLCMQDFEDAILQMDIKGHMKKDFERTDADAETVAYHEAGHAVLAYLTKSDEVTSITVRPTTSGAGGFTMTENNTEDVLRSIGNYYNHMVMMYGGRASESILRGGVEKASAGASEDIRQVTRAAANYLSLRDGIDYSAFGTEGVQTVMNGVKTLLEDIWKRSIAVLKDNWDCVSAVAKELIETETVSKERFVEIMRRVEDERVLKRQAPRV